MEQVLKNSEDILKRAKERNSKDLLLDKYTLRFIKYIDVEKALDWLEELKSI